LRHFLRSLIAWLALCATLAPACAQQQVKIGVGYGLAFLPLYICEDMKLIEKHGKEVHLDLRPSFQRFPGAVQMLAAVDAGDIDMGPFGTAPLLAAWQEDKGKPTQLFAVSGITTLPLALLSNQPDEHSLADIKSGDRIAMPTLTSPQMFLLELQSEKLFGRFDKLSDQVVALPHAAAISAMVENSGAINAYFASPPFTELALRGANVHPLLTSSDVMSGKFSFLVMAATKAEIQAKPQLPEVIDKAIDEAARIIHDDPRRAAQIYLTHEPSGAINDATMEAVVRDIKDEFGSSVYGVQAMAEFMGRHGGLTTVPKSWKEIVAPSLLNSPSS
jgi:NitT/TauT family transport system substrate-binding protein